MEILSKSMMFRFLFKRESKKERKEKRKEHFVGLSIFLQNLSSRLVVIRGEGVWGESKMDKGGQLYGDGWKLNFCW